MLLALFFLDSDIIAAQAAAATSKPTKENDVTIAAIEASEEGRTGGAPPSVVMAHDMEGGIAGPTIGKKKAKVIQQTAASAAKKTIL